VPEEGGLGPSHSGTLPGRSFLFLSQGLLLSPSGGQFQGTAKKSSRFNSTYAARVSAQATASRRRCTLKGFHRTGRGEPLESVCGLSDDR
jgi:hypothetical protein